MASTSLSRTNTTTTSNRKTGTFSAWLKRSELASGNGGIITAYVDSNNYTVIYFDSSSKLSFLEYQSGSSESFVNTNKVFRDTSAWYHIVISIDATQSTASNRIKFYVNGVQETDLDNTNYPSDTTLNIFGNSSPINLGEDTTGSPHYFDGSMAHVHFIDGTAYDASAFGETDATTGIWKPKTAPSVTYGTNGFFLKFENSGAFGTDSSGNGNNFTVNGTMTQTIDTPSNVFATLNPLNVPTSNAPTFSNGNLKTVCGTTGGAYMGAATMGVSSGKYYAEMKVKTVDSVIAGVSANASEDARDNVYPGQQADSVGILLSNGQKYINDSGSTYGASLRANDILQIALDLDNNNVYFGKNGQWSNGSGSWNQSSPSSAISITASSNTTDGFYFFSVGDGGGSQAGDVEWNFGNGYFGTTAVASAQNPDDGIGIFEYSVPTGYKALCTKSINAQEYS